MFADISDRILISTKKTTMDAETDLAVFIRNLPLLGQNTSTIAEELEEAFVMKFHTFVVVFHSFIYSLSASAYVLYSRCCLRHDTGVSTFK